MKRRLPIQAALRVDTREQQPYRFKAFTSEHVVFDIQRVGLPTADYAASLHADDPPADVLLVERKSHADLLGTLSAGRSRFEQELERMRPYGWRGLVIEATLADLIQHPGGVHPRAIVGSLCAFSTRFDLHVIYAGDRRHAEALVWRLAERWVRDRAALVGREVAA